MRKPSKREARLAREAEKLVAQKEKSARLRARPVMEPTPRFGSNPADRTPRKGASPDSIFQMQMAWTADEADREGEWSWGPRDWTDDDWSEVIERSLNNFATLTWAEIERFSTDNGHRSHHPMPVDSIVQESQNRLYKIEKMEEEIYRFRVGNRRRIWGFRRANVFDLVWYDPLHNIYPTEPD